MSNVPGTFPSYEWDRRKTCSKCKEGRRLIEFCNGESNRLKQYPFCIKCDINTVQDPAVVRQILNKWQNELQDFVSLQPHEWLQVRNDIERHIPVDYHQSASPDAILEFLRRDPPTVESGHSIQARPDGDAQDIQVDKQDKERSRQGSPGRQHSRVVDEAESNRARLDGDSDQPGPDEAQHNQDYDKHKTNNDDDAQDKDTHEHASVPKMVYDARPHQNQNRIIPLSASSSPSLATNFLVVDQSMNRAAPSPVLATFSNRSTTRTFPPTNGHPTGPVIHNCVHCGQKHHDDLLFRGENLELTETCYFCRARTAYENARSKTEPAVSLKSQLEKFDDIAHRMGRNQTPSQQAEINQIKKQIREFYQLPPKHQAAFRGRTPATESEFESSYTNSSDEYHNRTSLSVGSVVTATAAKPGQKVKPGRKAKPGRKVKPGRKAKPGPRKCLKCKISRRESWFVAVAPGKPLTAQCALCRYKVDVKRKGGRLLPDEILKLYLENWQSFAVKTGITVSDEDLAEVKRLCEQAITWTKTPTNAPRHVPIIVIDADDDDPADEGDNHTEDADENMTNEHANGENAEIDVGNGHQPDPEPEDVDMTEPDAPTTPGARSTTAPALLTQPALLVPMTNSTLMEPGTESQHEVVNELARAKTTLSKFGYLSLVEKVEHKVLTDPTLALKRIRETVLAHEIELKELAEKIDHIRETHGL